MSLIHEKLFQLKNFIGNENSLGNAFILLKHSAVELALYRKR